MINTLSITTKDIFEKQQVLTLAKAKELKGKQIACTSPEDRMNQAHVSIFTVGEIVSKWDVAAKTEYSTRPEKYHQYNNYQEYWSSFMTEEQINEAKSDLILLDANGSNHFIVHTKYWNFYAEPTFTGSDADREVYYMEL